MVVPTVLAMTAVRSRRSSVGGAVMSSYQAASQKILNIGVGRAQGFGVARTARRAAVLSERFLRSLSRIELGRIVGLTADNCHQPAEPLAGLSPVVRDIHERVGFKADGVARAVVVVIDSLRRLEGRALLKQPIAVPQRGLGQFRGDLVVGMRVVRPE